MKKIVITIFLSCLFCSACTDFLDEIVYTQATPTSFYKDKKQLEAALNAAYSAFQIADYYDHSIFLVADLSTNMLDSRWSQVYNNYSEDYGHEQYKNIWEAAWKANNAVNAVIDEGDKAEMNNDLKNRYIGEAKFLRALNYFNLIRMYGRVPLVLDFISDLQQDIYPHSMPLDSVYNQIITDLKDAEDVLPWTYPTSEIGRATKGAAKSLLGKVYLTYAGYRLDSLGISLEKGDHKYYELAAKKLKEVIDSNVYDLFDDYGDNFRNETENGIEHIFSIQYKQGALGVDGWGGEGSGKQTRWAPTFGITHTAWETFRATKTFYASFSSKDKRKKAIFLDSFVDGNNILQSYPETLSFPYVKKYLRDIREGNDNNYSTASPVDGEENTDVIRYSDILLMYSEALIEESQNITVDNLWGINKVRKRAGLTEYKPTDFSDLESFRQALLNEREWELCYEGHGWFDYVRMGQLKNRVGKVTKDKFYYWPIPYIDILKNPNLKQSPGW